MSTPTSGEDVMHEITPREARRRLDHLEAATANRDAERRIHALATAGFGVLMGGYLTISRVVEETRFETVALVLYVVLLGALAAWQTRGALAWPRHARRTSWLGLGGTFVLFMGAVVLFNVREVAREDGGAPGPENVVLLVAAGVLTATPMLVAAVRIRRGGGV
ncbi:hypothetical protein KC207_09435 [Phycicoccus sp. BSK3Z-2]|uniref:Uncharacterized protein n=1 Tax=Phycicoccus avicenniae TaxID=2828860 RepID=A0A941I0X3_9MICO|nr:hypothetical protein [Phycicoccus avicenniae]MBR7743509.1 hypothetical protein [Phycicoccus avicenniae]